MAACECLVTTKTGRRAAATPRARVTIATNHVGDANKVRGAIEAPVNEKTMTRKQ